MVTMYLPCFCLLLCIVGARGWYYNEKVCYDDYGCFDNKSPYTNSPNVPQKPSKMGLKLRLNNRYNKDLDNPDYLDPLDSSSITRSRYNSSVKLVVIIFGWRGKITDDWVFQMAEEILEVDDVNVICVDWKDGAKSTNYNQVIANTRLVGKMISVLLTNINTVVGTPYSDIHIIGFSLGAHIGGYIGEHIAGLGRISGLDPAGPGFEDYGSVVRLDSNDALFVDVIHTDMENLSELGAGTERESGDVDFYPNGGKNQPGCSEDLAYYTGLLFSFKISKIYKTVTCSHKRAVYLYISSIRRCIFTAFLCSSYSNYKTCSLDCCNTTSGVLGYWANRLFTPGTYYLQTTSDSPYC